MRQNSNAVTDYSLVLCKQIKMARIYIDCNRTYTSSERIGGMACPARKMGSGTVEQRRWPSSRCNRLRYNGIELKHYRDITQIIWKCRFDLENGRIVERNKHLHAIDSNRFVGLAFRFGCLVDR